MCSKVRIHHYSLFSKPHRFFSQALFCRCEVLRKAYAESQDGAVCITYGDLYGFSDPVTLVLCQLSWKHSLFRNPLPATFPVSAGHQGHFSVRLGRWCRAVAGFACSSGQCRVQGAAAAGPTDSATPLCSPICLQNRPVGTPLQVVDQLHCGRSQTLVPTCSCRSQLILALFPLHIYFLFP